MPIMKSAVFGESLSCVMICNVQSCDQRGPAVMLAALGSLSTATTPHAHWLHVQLAYQLDDALAALLISLPLHFLTHIERPSTFPRHHDEEPPEPPQDRLHGRPVRRSVAPTTPRQLVSRLYDGPPPEREWEPVHAAACECLFKLPAVQQGRCSLSDPGCTTPEC